MVSCLSHCVSEWWLPACRRLSLMETNVDTSHPRNCSQLTRCLIKAIYWFIHGRMKVIANCAHAASTSPQGLLRIFPKNLLIASAWRTIADDPGSYILSKFLLDTQDGSTATTRNSTSDCSSRLKSA